MLTPDVRATLTADLARLKDAHWDLLRIPTIPCPADQDRLGLARRTIATAALSIQRLLADNENPGANRG
jgi:hypothetical protein